MQRDSVGEVGVGEVDVVVSDDVATELVDAGGSNLVGGRSPKRK